MNHVKGIENIVVEPVVRGRKGNSLSFISIKKKSCMFSGFCTQLASLADQDKQKSFIMGVCPDPLHNKHRDGSPRFKFFTIIT